MQNAKNKDLTPNLWLIKLLVVGRLPHPGNRHIDKPEIADMLDGDLPQDNLAERRHLINR